LHPTHAPEPVSQIWASFGQDEAAVHAGWHLRSLGQHAGVDAGQSAFVPHWPHAPRTQIGAEAGQSEPARHSTQPRFGSHLRLPQPFVPPQIAFPAPGPLTVTPLPPPQAAMTTKTPKAKATQRMILWYLF
jgi:hypothetical protein